MNKKIVLIAIAILLIIIIASIFGIKPAVKSGFLDGINLPKGFKIDVFADTLDFLVSSCCYDIQTYTIYAIT